jgi:cyclase
MHKEEHQIWNIYYMRILAKVDTKSEFVIKGVQLEGVEKVGHIDFILHELVRLGVSEFILSDTMASLYMRNSLISVIGRHTKDFRYPICAGGGIQSVSDATDLIKAGADRISINTYALENRSIIGSLTKALGISCVVSQIDVRKINNEFRLFSHAGRELSEYDLKSWLNFLSENYVGEIVVTSIDRDGTGRGIDWDLINFMESESPLPYVYSGGLADMGELKSLEGLNKMSGIAAMKLFIDGLPN